MSDKSYDNVFESDAFRGLSSESRELIKEFLEKSKNKSPQETAVVFMEYYNKLGKNGKISPEQQKLMVESLKAGLSDENRRKFAVVEQMFSSFKGGGFQR